MNNLFRIEYMSITKKVRTVIHNHNFANPVKRVFSTLIDWTIFYLIAGLIAFPFDTVNGLTFFQSMRAQSYTDFAALAGLNQGAASLSNLIRFIVLIIFFLIIPIYIWNGQTIGKKLLGIKIVKESGHAANKIDILKRYSLYIGVYIVKIVPLVGWLGICLELILPFVNVVMLFTDKMKQTALDKLGRTIIVNAD